MNLQQPDKMDGNLVILAGGISSRMKKAAARPTNLDARLIADAEHKAKAMIGAGQSFRPFLDYLLLNAREAGYEDVVMVVGEHDQSIKRYYGTQERTNLFHGLKISYAFQSIPPGRTKPLGTADALLQALKFRTDWQGKSFTVCNSDNLYSKTALKLLLESPYKNAMIDYDSAALCFDQNRIRDFAVTKKDANNFLLDILEKPSPEDIERVKGKDGRIGVSMNIFQLKYDLIFPYLERVPLHPVRLEKELPTAVVMMIKQNPQSMYAFPLGEPVPDLTTQEDINRVKDYLQENFHNSIFDND